MIGIGGQHRLERLLRLGVLPQQILRLAERKLNARPQQRAGADGRLELSRGLRELLCVEGFLRLVEKQRAVLRRRPAWEGSSKPAAARDQNVMRVDNSTLRLPPLPVICPKNWLDSAVTGLLRSARFMKLVKTPRSSQFTFSVNLCAFTMPEIVPVPHAARGCWAAAVRACRAAVMMLRPPGRNRRIGERRAIQVRLAAGEAAEADAGIAVADDLLTQESDRAGRR